MNQPINGFRAGLIQMNVRESKEENLLEAEKMVKRAVSQGAELAVLPEMFNCPYQTGNFPLYAEVEGAGSWQALSRIARENGITLVGGSIPEIDGEKKVYNTSYVFGPSGEQIGKHRKMHLFDIDIQGGQYFKESDILTPGNTAAVFDTPFGKMGVMICYDLRFPELARILALEGAKAIFVPGAFNMTTGPAHWELLFRARALDNQVYMLGAAPARDPSCTYISFANSIVTDPWGGVAARLGSEEGILITDIDIDKVDGTREQMPLLKHRREDVYQLAMATKSSADA